MRMKRRLAVWQIALLVVIAAGAAAGAYVVFGGPDDQAAGGLTEDEQLVMVQRGDLLNQVQTGGTLSFPNKESLRISGSSVVKDVLVSEGQTVVEGQALITLDDATLAAHDEGVAKARIALREAQRTLENLLPDAQAERETALATLVDAESTLSDVLEDHDEMIDDATEAVTTAEEEYRDIFAAWLGVTLRDADLSVPPARLMEGWGLDLANLLTPGGIFEDTLGSFYYGSPPDDPATAWSETAVYAILNFYPGGIVATCEETGEHPPNGHCLQKGFDDAWTNLETARDARVDAGNAKSAAVSKAEDMVDAAREMLEEAEMSVADATEGEGGLMVDLRRAELASATLALEDLLKQREEATLRAPFAGIVSVLNAVPGEALPEDVRVAVEILDTSVVELIGSVDETDVLRVAEGDPAEVFLDALPGQTFSGVVSSIASAAESQQGIAVFSLKIQIRVPDGVVLREGMNATATLSVELEESVLLVPVQAVYGTFREPLLRVMEDGEIVVRSVTLGNSDGFWVVVEEGATENEEIIMQVSQAEQFQGFSGPGGGRRVVRADS